MQMDLRSSCPLSGSGPRRAPSRTRSAALTFSLPQCEDRLCLNRSRLYGVPVDDRREHFLVVRMP
jgi:hypothetical protein